MAEFLFDGPEPATRRVLLAHGAGGPMDAPAMVAAAAALAAEGLRSARFEFDYMAARRSGRRRPPPRAETLAPEYLAAVAALPGEGPLVIGGKSMGGRVASLVADELYAAGTIVGLLCLGYPFHRPGRPEQLRTAHLTGLRTPTLICQGTRDPFGGRDEVVWASELRWNGVAILARGAEPVLTRTALPGDGADAQRRYIEAAVRGVLVASLYAPNGNPQPGPKFAYKLAWMERVETHAAVLRATGAPVVLAGDWNVAPEARDVCPSRSYDDNAVVQPAPRAAFRRMIDRGWTDALRRANPDATLYTFWDYRRERWRRDAGLRLDHLLLSPALAPRLRAAGVDRDMRGRTNASDHAPVWIELQDTC